MKKSELEINEYWGFLLIDKPVGASSHDIVNEVRYRLKCKAGHTGTLDPFATGLLIIALGKATRLADYIQKQKKEYIVTLHLGEEKDSYDITGKTIETREVLNVPKEKLEKVLEKYKGEILQTPPIYSALKINGRKAYELARKGEIIEMKKRPVTIYEIEILSFNLPEIELRVLCSSGTYIRSLVHDIGVDLKTLAYAKKLRRTQIGEMRVENSYTLLDFFNTPIQEVERKIIPPIDAVSFMNKIELNDAQYEEIRHGRIFELLEETKPFENTGIAVYNGDVAALIKIINEDGRNKVRAEKVFLP